MAEDKFLLERKKKWESSIASENYKLTKEYRTYAMPWRTLAKKLEDARFGKQYSQAEEELILRFRQAPLPISVSTAICDSADAMMVSTKPTVHVAPIMYPHNQALEENSRKVAQIFRTLIQKSWHDSLGNLHFDRAVRDYTNVGHGLLYVIPRLEGGEFKVEFSHLPWQHFYPDPASKDPLYRDMDNMIYAVGISHKAAYRFVRSIEDDLSFEKFQEYWCKGGDVSETSIFEEDNSYGGRNLSNKEMIMFCQRLTLENETVYYAFPTPKGINLNTDGTQIGYRTYSTITPELDRLRAEGKITIEKKSKFCLCEYTSIGNLGYKNTFPISDLNIVPIVYDHRNNPYPYSRMFYLYPLQRALNKFIMSSILNMSLLNSTRVIAEAGSLLNKDQWTMDASMPGVVLEYVLPNLAYSKPPTVVEAQPMSEAWLHMPKYLTYMMEYISGIYSSMMGDGSNVPDVFSTVATLQSMGSLKIKRRMAACDASLSVAGKIAADFYKEYAPINGYSTFWIPNQKDETTKYNEVDIREEVDANGKKRYTPYIKPESDLRQGFNTVRFVSQASNGYESATEAALLSHLATQLKVKELIKPIIKRMNIADADDAIEDLDFAAKAQQQIKQYEDQIKEMEQRSRHNINQIEQLAVSLKAAQAKGSVDKELAKFTANPLKYISDSFAMKQPTNNGEQNV